MTKVFISYSHADESFRRQLDVHLTSLRRQGIVEVWHDRQIRAGDDFGKEIDAALINADVILLLVSADFIASEYCYSIEMTEALKRHDQGSAAVIPVILRACDWKDLPFGKLNATPADGKPVNLFADLDSALLNVVVDIKLAIQNVYRNPTSRASAPRVTETGTAVVEGHTRSGNLRIRNAFSDYDRQQFRLASYEYVARYFEGSMSELEQRNAGIRSMFRRLDATSFEASLFNSEGKQRCHCGIWLGNGRGSRGDIGYSASGVGARNSFNESLSVGDDGTSLGLIAIGMLAQHDDRKLLTQEGAAEYFWSAFIRPPSNMMSA